MTGPRGITGQRRRTKARRLRSRIQRTRAGAARAKRRAYAIVRSQERAIEAGVMAREETTL